jgi:hypothetical protein
VHGGDVRDALGRPAVGPAGPDVRPDAGPAQLITDGATLVRMVAGRSPDPARFTLSGADPADYLLFG